MYVIKMEIASGSIFTTNQNQKGTIMSSKNKHNTIGKGEKERAVNGGNDKFYTKQFIADYCSNIVLSKYGTDVKYIEPTAGNGAFMNVLPNIVGYDLIPERDDILQKDVFENDNFDTNTIVVGNPPFGTNASLAQAIFNHIASFKVKAICFIVPKTFKKESMHNKLNLNYHIVFEQDIIDNAFTVDGKDKHVPCVFQIWEYKAKKRKIKEPGKCKYIEFTNKENADIAIRRAGGKAGQLLEGLNHSKESTYFIKILNPLVLKAIKLIDLSCVDNTARVRSISKNELCNEINRVMEILDEN